ncbi:DUF620 domain-containing protein [Pseudomonas sp. RIT412]|nr:DUF620 domain-containing protein [Pseudomonas sp. RIT 409]RAU55876.1 DUF620 domain-containing protein [Pseudomonas sp. RIT 412]
MQTSSDARRLWPHSPKAGTTASKHPPHPLKRRMQTTLDLYQASSLCCFCRCFIVGLRLCS